MITLSQFAKGATIPAELVPNAQITVNVLNAVFEAFPGVFLFSSGYRTPAHNAAVGGVPDSFHVKGFAGDFYPNDGNFAKYKSGVISILDRFGFELIDESKKPNAAHFHIEPQPGATIKTNILPSGSADKNSNGLAWLFFLGIAVIALRD
jgi:hypothetical protein